MMHASVYFCSHYKYLCYPDFSILLPYPCQHDMTLNGRNRHDAEWTTSCIVCIIVVVYYSIFFTTLLILFKLILFSNSLEGKIPNNLSHCKSLQRIRLQNNRFSGELSVDMLITPSLCYYPPFMVIYFFKNIVKYYLFNLLPLTAIVYFVN